MTTLLDLPLDILTLIFPLLNPKDFLSLCTTCTALHACLHDDLYWQQKTQVTFRLPNRPSAPTDGELWKKLYKRLLTQTKVYIWGQHPQFPSSKLKLVCGGFGSDVVPSSE